MALLQFLHFFYSKPLICFKARYNRRFKGFYQPFCPLRQKFKSRFEYIEENSSKELNDMTLEEMDLLWDKAKTIED